MIENLTMHQIDESLGKLGKEMQYLHWLIVEDAVSDDGTYPVPTHDLKNELQLILNRKDQEATMLTIAKNELQKKIDLLTISIEWSA